MRVRGKKFSQRHSRSSHQADSDTGAGKWRRLAAFLFLGPRHGERAGSLMLFQVVAIQPSERWMWRCETRRYGR